MRKILPYKWSDERPSLIGIILIAVSFTVGALLFSKCDDKQAKPNTIIQKQLIERQRIDTVIIRKDSIRTKYVTRYRTIRHDSIIPCEIKLALCDTVIRVDSSLIASLKQEIKLDSAILQNYATITKQDSVIIAKLERKLRRSKKLNRVLFVLTLGAIGGANIR